MSKPKVLYVYSDHLLNETAWAVGNGKVQVGHKDEPLDDQIEAASILVGRHPFIPYALDVRSYAAGVFGLDYYPALVEVLVLLDNFGVKVAPFDWSDAADMLKAVRSTHKALRKIRAQAPRDIWNIV